MNNRFTGNLAVDRVLKTITDLHIEGKYIWSGIDYGQMSRGDLLIQYKWIDGGSSPLATFKVPQKALEDIPVDEWVAVGEYLNTLNYLPSPEIVQASKVRVTGHKGLDKLLNELLEKHIEGDLQSCYVYNRGSEEKPEYAIFYEYTEYGDEDNEDYEPCTVSSGHYWCHDYKTQVEEFINDTMNLSSDLIRSYDAYIDYKKSKGGDDK